MEKLTERYSCESIAQIVHNSWAFVFKVKWLVVVADLFQSRADCFVYGCRARFWSHGLMNRRLLRICDALSPSHIVK